MKHFILVLFFFLRVLGAQAQTLQQRTDSVPSESHILSWISVLGVTPHTLRDIALPSKDTMIVVGDTLYRTTDGGVNWQVLPSPAIGAVLFANNQIGYIFTPPVDFGRTQVYYTYDAGMNWHLNNDSLQIAEECSAAIGLDTVFVSAGGAIRRSTDRGITWLRPAHPSMADLHAMAFRDSKNGVAVGAPQPGPSGSQFGACCWITSDGGQSWQQTYTGARFDLLGLAHCTGDTYVAMGGVAGGGGLRTTNGGRTWDTLAINTSPYGLIAVAGHGMNAIAVGAHGLIYHSFDSGLTWQQEFSGTIQTLESVKMFDDTTAIIAGDNGTLLRSNTQAAGVPPTISDSISIQVFPNPSNTQVQFLYSLPGSQVVSLNIYTSSGSLISSLLSNAPQDAGAHNVELTTTALASGDYVYQLITGPHSQSGTFTIIR